MSTFSSDYGVLLHFLTGKNTAIALLRFCKLTASNFGWTVMHFTITANCTIHSESKASQATTHFNVNSTNF
jgi:hypothetical protein